MMKGAYPKVKALFATGFVSPEIEAHLQTEDSSAVITKPYSPDEMSKKIAAFLQKSAGVSVPSRAVGHSSDVRNQ